MMMSKERHFRVCSACILQGKVETKRRHPLTLRVGPSKTSLHKVGDRALIPSPRAGGPRFWKGYKAALSVRVFQTIGRICCMDDTMCFGKFFTRAVTA